MTYEIYQTPVSTKYCFRSWDKAGDDFDIHVILEEKKKECI